MAWVCYGIVWYAMVFLWIRDFRIDKIAKETQLWKRRNNKDYLCIEKSIITKACFKQTYNTYYQYQCMYHTNVQYILSIHITVNNSLLCGNRRRRFESMMMIWCMAEWRWCFGLVAICWYVPQTPVAGRQYWREC